MRVQLAVILAFAVAVAATIGGGNALASSPTPKPTATPVPSCVTGFMYGSTTFKGKYVCKTGTISCPAGYYLIQGGDFGPRWTGVYGNNFQYYCLLNP